MVWWGSGGRSLSLMWPRYTAQGPFGENLDQFGDCHKPPSLSGSQEPPAGLRLEAVRLMATTRSETGKIVDSGRQVDWIIPCSQNQRESGLFHIPGGSMQ